MNETWNETIKRVKSQIIRLRRKPFREQLVLLMSIYTITIVFGSLTVGLFVLNFSQPEATRNLLILGAALTSLCFLFWRTRIAARTLTVEQLALAMQHINSEKMSLRLSGIRTLEQIAQHNKEERKKIIQVLSAHIREIAPLGPTRKTEERHRHVDIETAIEVLAEIAIPFEDEKCLLCDLQETNLSGLRLYGTDLTYFDLTDANVSNTHFLSVDLGGTELGGVNISNTAFDDVEGSPQETRKKSFYYKGHLPNALPDGLKPEEKESPIKND